MYQKYCKKCGRISLYGEMKTNNGLYCDECGAWIKWLSEDESRGFEHSQKNKKQEEELIRKEGESLNDYSDIWYEMHRSGIAIEKRARNLRKCLVQELSPDDMIWIIFMYHISNMHDSDVISLTEKWLKSQ